MKIFEYLSILKKREKFGFLIYFIIFYFSYFFEMIGIGLIIPLLGKSKITDNSFNSSFLDKLFEIFDNLNVAEILLLMIVLIILKNIFLILANLFNQYLYFILNSRLSSEAFEYYIDLDYEILLEKKVHSINRKVLTEIPIFVDNLFRYIDFVSLFILFLIYLLFGAIVFVEALYFIIPIFLLSFLINKFLIKKKLINFGKKRVHADDSITNAIVEFLPGLREILVYDLKKKIVQKFFFEIKNKFLVILKLNFLTKNNKNIFEFLIAVIILFIATILYAKTNIDIGNYLSIVIFFIALFIRIMPVLAGLLSIRQKIIFTSPSANETIKEIKEIKFINSNTNKNLFQSHNINLFILELKNINFSYGKNKIFENLNFKIDTNSKKILLIHGKNGSGKSTLIDLISGVLKPTKGEYFYNGDFFDFKNLNKIISLSAQNTVLFNGTIKDNITMNFFSHNEAINNEKLKEAIEFADLGNFIEKFEKKLEHPISDGGKNLSGGQRQRIGFARAFYKDSNILVFDEPTNNLDKKGKSQFIKNITKLSKEKKIIIISHDNDLKKIDSEKYEINNKNIVRSND